MNHQQITQYHQINIIAEIPGTPDDYQGIGYNADGEPVMWFGDEILLIEDEEIFDDDCGRYWRLKNRQWVRCTKDEHDSLLFDFNL